MSHETLGVLTLTHAAIFVESAALGVTWTIIWRCLAQVVVHDAFKVLRIINEPLVFEHRLGNHEVGACLVVKFKKPHVGEASRCLVFHQHQSVAVRRVPIDTIESARYDYKPLWDRCSLDLGLEGLLR